MRLNERSLTNLKGVHNDLVRVVKRADEILASSAPALPFVVTEGLRTKERQKRLVAAGKSWTMNSRHLTGHAVDVVDADDFGYDMPDMERIALAMKQSASELGVPIVWGGDWKQGDTPHFELDRKHYPANGITPTEQAKETATKAVTSKPGLLTTGALSGYGIVNALPSLPEPPDLGAVQKWQSFGEQTGNIANWALQNPLVTLVSIGLALFFTFLPKKQVQE